LDIELGGVRIQAHVTVVATARLGAVARAGERAQVQTVRRVRSRVFNGIPAPAFLLILGGRQRVACSLAEGLALLVGVVGLLGGGVDLVLQVAAEGRRVLETADPLVLGRAVGEDGADLAGDNGSVGLDIVDTEVLGGVQSVEAVRVQDPDQVDVLRGMVGLHRRRIDCHRAIGTGADVDFLAFEQLSIRIGCCQLSADRRLGLGDGQDGAANVANADLPGDRRSGYNVAKVHDRRYAVVPASFTGRHGNRSNGRVASRCREDDGIDAAVRPYRNADCE